MSSRSVRDAWLLATLERLLPDGAAARLLAAVEESYWESALRLGLTTDDAILAALARRFRMPLADLSTLDPHAREVVPEALARRHRVVPLAVTDATLDLATADPTDMDAERALAFATGRTVRLQLASPVAIVDALEALYVRDVPASGVIARILETVADKYDVHTVDEGEQSDTGDLSDAGTDRPVIKLVDYVIAEGIASRASDIHLEPDERGLAVRYRVDGVLRPVLDLPRAAGVPLVSRVKIISGLDIADRLRPQDGRARVVVNGRAVDLRISTLPAAHGEKVVVRILDGASGTMTFEAMGLNPDDMARVQRLLQTREGVILVTGPTGSGKTTTLYTALRQLQQRGGVNVVTVEDPVEYRLPGIVQVQVNERASLTFAAALRSILRQDPDVVLVGEIRDRETAGIAVQASLTGHLVFSTLHTIDAASSVTRLVDIGVESYKIGAALKGIVAQRLLRRLCRACKRPASAAPPPGVQRWIPAGAERHEAAGCAECGHTGYHGRVAILEILVTDPEVERRIALGEPLDRIVEAARANGMRSLWESGVEQVLAGATSVDELMRVVDVPAPSARSAPPGPRSSRAPLGAPAVPEESPTPLPPCAPVLPAALFQLVDDLDPAAGDDEHGACVLLVEDEAPLRSMLAGLLEREGYAVLTAADGVEALDLVDREGPDLVVLDLALPRLDGHAVLGRLRARAMTRQLPVLVLTACEDEDAEVRAFDGGADDLVAKPLRARALVARVRALLRRSAATRAGTGWQQA